MNDQHIHRHALVGRVQTFTRGKAAAISRKWIIETKARVLMMALLLLMAGAGCRCLRLDCADAPVRRLEVRSLMAGGEGKDSLKLSLQAADQSIPVSKNVKVCAAYESRSDLFLDGDALVVLLNDAELGRIQYAHEKGKKEAAFLLDGKLKPGDNKLQLVTILYNTQVAGHTVKSRAGLVLLDDGQKVLEKCYPVPENSFQPVTDSWALSKH